MKQVRTTDQEARDKRIFELKDKGLDQVAIASRLGISQALVSKVLTGYVRKRNR